MDRFQWINNGKDTRKVENVFYLSYLYEKKQRITYFKTNSEEDTKKVENVFYLSCL